LGGGSGTAARFGSSSDGGTVSLSGSFSVFAGGTAGAIDGGTVVLGNSSAANAFGNMSGGVTVGSSATPATLDLNGNTTTVFNLAGTSAGTITNNGGTATTLFARNTGTNTYTGSTSIDVTETLRIGNGGTTGSIVSNVAVGGTLIFNRSDSATYGGQLSGAGAVQQNGTGKLTLTGDNSGYTGAMTINAGTLSVSADNNLGAAAASLTIGNGVLQTTSTFTSSRTVTLSAAGSGIDVAAGTTLTLNGAIGGAGSLTKTGSGSLTLSAANAYAGGTTVNAGEVVVGNNSALSAGTVTFADGTTLRAAATNLTIGNAMVLNGTATMVAFLAGQTTLSGPISGSGGLTKGGLGVLILSGPSTYSGPTTVQEDFLVAGGTNVFSAASAFTVAGPGLTFVNLNGFSQTIGSLAGDAEVNNNTGAVAVTLTTGGNNTSTTFSGIIRDGGAPLALTKTGAGTFTLSGANTYSGGTTIAGGLINFNAASNFGTGPILLNGGGLQWAAGTSTDISSRLAAFGALGATFDTNGNTVTLASTLSGIGGVTKTGAGALVLAGTDTYSGPTTVAAGTLTVNGSIANSAVTVNSGAMLSGTGTVGGLTINSGATFAPGNSPGTMTVQGNLAFQSGALYLVQVNSTTASNTVVSGSATLAGTVQAAFAAGSYATRTYTILSAAGGLGGTTFNTLTTSNLPAGFTASLSYTATDAILNLTATLGQPVGPSSGPSAPSGPGALACAFSLNQCNVANGLNAFFNNGGALPPAFVTIFRLTGANLGNALSQLSGEAATGAQQGAFQLTNQFLGIMLDPFVDGRSNPLGGSAVGFAPERAELPDDIALACYGGGNRTSGDPAVVGSHDLSATTAGGAAGLDYRLAPGTVVGFALAGGGTSWGLAQGLGTGKSDAFQAGLYGTARSGSAYLAAALAYTNHWMSTDRFAFAGDHLSANFNAQSFGGRVESGYRFATIYGGLTPYAAILSQTFHTPGYTETDLTNGGFALGFNSRSATDTRSELGGRFDRLLLLNPEAALTLRGRVAWAHDWISDPSLATLFQTLPGASFVVNGATPAKNSALTSAGVEYRLANGVVLLGKFDGEFASHASTYAGTGTVRYTW
jgi:outer membrane autotransporter protein